MSPQAEILMPPLALLSVIVADSMSTVAPASQIEGGTAPAFNWMPFFPELVIEPPAGPSTLIEWAMIRTPSVPGC